MPTHCPLCQSKNISKSKRRGLLESVVFTLIRVRPYRCQDCDLRFFRRAAPHGHEASRIAPQVLGQTFKELGPRFPGEGTQFIALRWDRGPLGANPLSTSVRRSKLDKECNSPIFFEANGDNDGNPICA
jgi:hypothetical protein